MNDDNVHRLDEGPAVPVLNLPNALTVLRLVLVPVFVWLMVMDGTPARWWALGVFVVAAAPDQLDGHLARSWNLVTDFGRLVDPIADKALTLGAFVMLSVDGLVPWWFTVLVAVRELGITGLRAVLLRRGIVVAANSGGKLKTVLQMLFIVLMLVPWESLLVEGPAATVRIVAWVVGAGALALTLWSGGVYVVEGARLMRATR
ncbi:MAG: CDP-diacylglycerol--glycerol-3-phosphate 3-phosphatidyltransferase [Actinomyces sp.]|nr:CDP-diacylglycerol--glycerol-3-phosphate 3-phosphatidyltransferase [Actinomyces sp.]